MCEKTRLCVFGGRKKGVYVCRKLGGMLVQKFLDDQETCFHYLPLLLLCHQNSLYRFLFLQHVVQFFLRCCHVPEAALCWVSYCPGGSLGAFGSGPIWVAESYPWRAY